MATCRGIFGILLKIFGFNFYRILFSAILFKRNSLMENDPVQRNASRVHGREQVPSVSFRF